MIFSETEAIFTRTKEALLEFMAIITPIIENAKDDHERLYWHHIYEEEEHRSDRLDVLLPKIQAVLNNERDIANNKFEFVHLLQDISLEKFGLHNFLEHLDLSLFQFKETEHEGKIQSLRDLTYDDYQQMKGILERLNQEFQVGQEFHMSIPTDEKDGKAASLKIDAYTDHQVKDSSTTSDHFFRKKLTVGSLKQT
ncbi:IMEF encapsulin system ferritin-like cargo protein [Bacillus sp. B15-48]|uniref:IMEF encapsulin system ferritin-like cargo protein n=1 Tax=Bacillus sp. B15-48 TaxID=1548601 RepID=UPI00193FCA93|nr:IMEF encapsulin system ferritin-like cargo protein [Bacillus sp. B15-48]MBM4761574.1 hypothetical protein [Bacillus sp. B15-48]